MSLPYNPDLIPRARRGAEVLLESVGFDPDQLTETQRQAIRKLYRLDDSRSIEQLIQAGEISIVSDDMEAETDAINRLDREDEL